MSGWKVIAENGNERPVDSRSEAEEVKEEMEQLGMTVEIETPKSDGGATEESVSDSIPEEPIDVQEAMEQPPKEEMASVDSSGDMQQANIGDDPLEYVPGHFVDDIQGVPTINRKGYCVLAERYGISVTAEPVTLASDTEFEYAEFKAVATTKDGQEYSGFGSAHVERQDGDDEYLLNELAETRALKRATAWATGVGITAVEELKNEL